MSGMHRYRVVNDVLVAGTAGTLAEDEQWKKFIEDLNTAPITKYLNVTYSNVVVTSTQRKAVFDALAKRKLKVAVVTESAMVRGIVTAASWFGANVNAFAMKDLEKAFEYLGIPGHISRRVTEAIREFKIAYDSGQAS